MANSDIIGPDRLRAEHLDGTGILLDRLVTGHSAAFVAQALKDMGCSKERPPPPKKRSCPFLCRDRNSGLGKYGNEQRTAKLLPDTETISVGSCRAYSHTRLPKHGPLGTSAPTILRGDHSKYQSTYRSHGEQGPRGTGVASNSPKPLGTEANNRRDLGHVCLLAQCIVGTVRGVHSS